MDIAPICALLPVCAGETNFKLTVLALHMFCLKLVLKPFKSWKPFIPIECFLLEEKFEMKKEAAFDGIKTFERVAASLH
jgi:hypothetical protein